MTDIEPKEYADYKSDHDLLIELRVVSSEIRKDIKDLKDGTHDMLTDHELRLRVLEKDSNRWVGRQSTIGGAIGVAAAFIAAFISTGKW